jgi:hypothetical protein
MKLERTISNSKNPTEDPSASLGQSFTRQKTMSFTLEKVAESSKKEESRSSENGDHFDEPSIIDELEVNLTNLEIRLESITKVYKAMFRRGILRFSMKNVI